MHVDNNDDDEQELLHISGFFINEFQLAFY